MSSISPVSSSSKCCDAPACTPAGPDALPLPATEITVESLTAVLLTMEGRKAQGSTDCAQSQIESDAARQKEARERMEQAQREARERESDGSFWGKISSSLSSVSEVAVAAAAVATVATGGAGLPAFLALAGATMSMSATVGREAGLDSKLCTGLALGGMALSLSSGAAGVLGGANAAAASTSSTALTMRDVARTCNVVGGAARIGAGSTGMVAGYYHAEAERDSADALQDRQKASRYSEAQKDQIDRLNEIAQSATAAISLLIDMQRDAHATAMQVINTIGRRA